ncbi:delta-latroinsectotoxin-Lt1a protein [Tasmannia lanceolata]|uniref:delta-latroinsectotoxin-Lt1a protein n=1 Tax=Tasmannia lanceolata TaxID=3420 RepID=UPI00406296CC
MANQRSDGEEQEALFNSYPCAVYYVQSPSTISHANSSDCRNHDSALLSPFPNTTNRSQEASRFTLSRYSSSRGSNNSFLHEKKIAYDLQSHGNVTESGGENCPQYGGEEEEEDVGEGDGKGGIEFLSFGYSSSCVCVSFQIVWRLVVSLGVALLVFFLVTKPPPPKMSVKMAGVRQFGLGEGIDASGVTTKILTCNCSIDLEVDNRSKLFALQIRSPIIDMAFGRLKFASSQGEELYVESGASMTFRLYVGVQSKAMYGAGQSMEDMLESGEGLPLMIHVRLSSNIPVVWSLIRPKFRHNAHCLLVLDGAYDLKHHTQAYNSTCSTISYT